MSDIIDTTTEDLFDLESIEDVSSAEVQVKTPDGKPTGMFVTLAGPEHPDRKERAYAMARRKRSEMKLSGQIPVSDPVDDHIDETEELVASTLSWRGCKTPFSPTASRALYTDKKRAWLRDFVRAALGRRELFIQRSGGG